MGELAREALPYLNLALATLTLLIFAVRVPARLAVMEFKIDQLWRWYANDHRPRSEDGEIDAHLG